MIVSTRFVIFAFFALLLACGCVRRQGVERVEWSVMGTVAAIQAKSVDGSAWSAPVPVEGVVSRVSAEARGVLTGVETLLNAHAQTSELSRLAPLPDDQVVNSCDRVVRPCYEAAFALQKSTGGAFNPRWRGGKTLDLGAIAKGFAVDLAAERMNVPKGAAVLVDLGGNVKAVKGQWRTGVKDPGGSGFAAVVDLKEGEALATSATYFRGEHIYDGRTGSPATNGVASVTVLCDSAMWADGLSTTLFVLGPDEGRAFLDKHIESLLGGRGVEVLWILSDGRRLTYHGGARHQLSICPSKK